MVKRMFSKYKNNILEIRLSTVKMERYNEIRYTKS